MFYSSLNRSIPVVDNLHRYFLPMEILRGREYPDNFDQKKISSNNRL